MFDNRTDGVIKNDAPQGTAVVEGVGRYKKRQADEPNAHQSGDRFSSLLVSW
jgi:hypothetical protein